jgi:hypothetical protein
MKKTIIAGLIAAIMLPATSLAYGGFGVTPTVAPHGATIYPYDYSGNIQKKIYKLQIQVLKLKIELLKIQLKNRHNR